MMGLRLKEGISPERFQKLFGKEVKELLLPSTLDMLVDQKLLSLNKNTMKATIKGQSLLNRVLEKLLAN